jgi:hypothetical protein
MLSHNVMEKKMRTLLLNGFAIIAISTGLAACGETTGDRALSGAAIGAGTGAAVGAVGGPVGVGTGAAIGAGAGAITGAATSPSQVDLGRPAWER